MIAGLMDFVTGSRLFACFSEESASILCLLLIWDFHLLIPLCLLSPFELIERVNPQANGVAMSNLIILCDVDEFNKSCYS